ncbi:tetratricopeptide repeat protein [Pseudahrensia aquimaris]|uniref:Tetratricopeptide repeat protein n=1 Tax=Pseudahrensia aquimaris TaxID=744461 RepID=A0ABW3FJU2_9HYPH
MRILNVCLTALAASAITFSSFAAGSDSTKPPTKTQTTKVCKKGQVWNKKRKKCVNPQSGMLSDDEVYTAARELAYDGQFDNALKVLAVAANPNDPRILNYKGFANRKAGRVAEGMSYYQAALKIDPDYILVRSYMGQAFISSGDVTSAKNQLAEIEKRGGSDTWAYASLAKAISGEATEY